MKKPPTFREHDTKLALWLEDPKDPMVVAAFKQAIVVLRGIGFKIGRDPRVERDFACLGPSHRRGRKGDLEVKINHSGRCMEVEFFQNLVVTNRSGGEYDFDKRQKMPYLVGKQYELARRELSDGMVRLGLPALEVEVKRRGMELIAHRRAELSAFHRGRMYAKPPEAYNAESATKQTVADGDRVLFRDYDGRMRGGTAFYNINNMWWVLCPGDVVRNLASFHLWHAKDAPPLKGRQFSTTEARKRLERVKAKAVEAENYERAAAARDALQKMKEST